MIYYTTTSNQYTSQTGLIVAENTTRPVEPHVLTQGAFWHGTRDMHTASACAYKKAKVWRTPTTTIITMMFPAIITRTKTVHIMADTI